MIPLTAIVTHLKADILIAEKVQGRVYDHDVRRTREEEIFDDQGRIRPTISVDDQGGSGRAPFAPSGTYLDTVAIWIFARDTDDANVGRPVVAQLAKRVMEILHGWQDPETMAVLTYAGRLGSGAAAIEQGGMDQVRFNVAGVFASVND